MELKSKCIKYFIEYEQVDGSRNNCLYNSSYYRNNHHNITAQVSVSVILYNACWDGLFLRSSEY